MTTEQKMEWARMVLPAVAGAAGNVLSNRQQSANNQLTQQQTELGQMSNQAAIAQMLQQMKMQQAQQGLSAMPLGLEQQYVQKQRMMQALMPALANFQSARPTDPGIASVYRPGSNILGQVAGNPQLQQSFSDPSIETALGNYRRLVAQADPRISMQSLSGYGLGTGQDQGVEDVRMTALADQKAYEQAQTDLAQQQTNMTRGQQATQPEKKKGGGFWGKVGSIAKVAVPIVLAATGVGIPAAMAITAGTNIAASKMQGKDWGDALQSGAIGAATGAVGAGALGSGARAGISAGTQKAIAQGVLSGADAKMQGGSWNDALQSGIGGAATSKLADAAKARFQGSSSDGLNNAMGPKSLPLGSQNTDGNNPMTAWKSVLKNSPSMQLQSRPVGQTTQFQQPVQQQAPQYPMVNKVKQAVLGMPEPRMAPSHGGNLNYTTADPKNFTPPVNYAREFQMGAAQGLTDFGRGAMTAPLGMAYQGGDAIRQLTGMPRVMQTPEAQGAMTPPNNFAGQMGNMYGNAAMIGGMLRGGGRPSGPTQGQLGPGPQPRGLVGPGQKLLTEYSVGTQNEMAAKNIMDALSKLPPDQARALLQHPMAQQIFGALK